jgi:cytochrome P450
MRLRPVAPLGLFEANVDTVIANVRVPRGTTVAILPRAAAVADDHFADPRAFRPERWLKGLKGAHDLSAHIPFGSGPRMCPGRSLALIQMNTLLSSRIRISTRQNWDLRRRQRALWIYHVADRAEYSIERTNVTRLTVGLDNANARVQPTT